MNNNSDYWLGFIGGTIQSLMRNESIKKDDFRVGPLKILRDHIEQENPSIGILQEIKIQIDNYLKK